MDDLERVTSECLQRINSFGLENASIVIANAKAKAAFHAIGEYVAELDEKGALRTSAGITKLSQTGFRRMKRTQLKGFLLKMSQAARDNESRNPAFINKFRINHKNLNDPALLETGRAFYADSEAVEQDFEDYGFINFREILKTIIKEFEDAISGQDAANRARIGANATIDDVIDRALSGRRTLLIIMPNLFADNPGKLAEWAAASHIAKLPKGAPRNPTA